MRSRLLSGRSRRFFGLLAAIALVAAAAAASCTSKAAEPRPADWAQPVPSTAIGNWYKIDEGLYRSRQPDRSGFEEAKKRGIRTIVNLRAGHIDIQLVRGLGFHLVEIPMRAWHVSEDKIVRALKAIQAGPGPVLVFCQQGADRTGAVMAAYRVLIQGWTKDEAVAELKNGGYGYHWYYPNIPWFIRKMDVAKLRARLSGSDPTGPSGASPGHFGGR